MYPELKTTKAQVIECAHACFLHQNQFARYIAQVINRSIKTFDEATVTKDPDDLEKMMRAPENQLNQHPFL